MDLNELRKIPHLSASSIGDYLECGMLYKYGRIDRIPRECTSDALEFGTVIHKVLAEYYHIKMNGDKMILKDIHESFKIHWYDTADGRDDIQYSKGKSFESYLRDGVDLLSAWYHQLPDDEFKVVAIEEAFSFNLPGIGVPIIGAIDLIEESGNSIIITDFKTTSRAYSTDEVNNNMQMTVYNMAAKNGFPDHEILLRFDCLIKTKTPKFESYYTVRSEVDEKRLARKVEQVWNGITKDVFIANDTSWRHKNCPYRQFCDRYLEGGDSLQKRQFQRFRNI